MRTSAKYKQIGLYFYERFSLILRYLMSKNSDWLPRNQDNVSQWSDMSTRGLLFQWTSAIKII
jgi:hypothetical protein